MCVVSTTSSSVFVCYFVFFFQAEDGIRDLVRSRGLGDVYKRQELSDALRVGPVRVYLGVAGNFAILSKTGITDVYPLSLIHI